MPSAETPPNDKTSDAGLSLRAAADLLGLHYMTVYRYVRTGRLPAAKIGSEWRILRNDIDLVRDRLLTGRAAEPRTRYGPPLEQRLLAADQLGAWAVVSAAQASGVHTESVLLDIVLPALDAVATRSVDGEQPAATIAVATRITAHLVARLATPDPTRRSGYPNGSIIVGSTTGETSALPSMVVGELCHLRLADTIDLGANTPPEAFAQAVEQLRAQGRDRKPSIAPLLVAAIANDEGGEPFLADTIRRLAEFEGLILVTSAHDPNAPRGLTHRVSTIMSAIEAALPAG